MDKDRYKTTTQAAKLLSVSPDTVLKWVKAGKIKAHRTLGGHFRIPEEALNSVPTNSDSDPATEQGQQTVQQQYCWEFHSQDRDTGICKTCLIYRSRSRRCFELRNLAENFSCPQSYCSTRCEECDYYAVVGEKVTNILLISKESILLDKREKIDSHRNLRIKLASNEYECSALIESFKPDYIVIDCSTGTQRITEFCTALANDTRIPFARIILSSRIKKTEEDQEGKILGWIRKPFSVDQLKSRITTLLN